MQEALVNVGSAIELLAVLLWYVKSLIPIVRLQVQGMDDNSARGRIAIDVLRTDQAEAASVLQKAGRKPCAAKASRESDRLSDPDTVV